MQLVRDGKTVGEQHYLAHQSPASPDPRPFVLKKGRNEKDVRIDFRLPPEDWAKLQARLVGGLPGSTFKGKLESRAVPIHARGHSDAPSWQLTAPPNLKEQPGEDIFNGICPLCGSFAAPLRILATICSTWNRKKVRGPGADGGTHTAARPTSGPVGASRYPLTDLATLEERSGLHVQDGDEVAEAGARLVASFSSGDSVPSLHFWASSSIRS